MIHTDNVQRNSLINMKQSRVRLDCCQTVKILHEIEFKTIKAANFKVTIQYGSVQG